MGDRQVQSTQAAPWAPAQPYILQGLTDASRLYEQGGFRQDPYEGQTVAALTPYQEQAAEMVGDLATSGQQAMQGALGTIQAAQQPGTGMSEALRQRVMEDIMPGINQTFAGAGMTGSSLHQQNLAKGLASAMAPIEADLMNIQANRALQAAGMVPQMLAGSYLPAQQLAATGAQQQQQQQNILNAEMAREQAEQRAPISEIQDYLTLTSSLGGQYASTQGQTSQQPGPLGLLGLGMQAMPFFL